MKRSQLIHELSDLRAEVDRRLGKMLAELQRPRDAEEPPGKPGADYPVGASGMFEGRPMESRYPGTCCVCGQSFAKGAPIVYADKLAAHHGCGAVAPRGARE